MNQINPAHTWRVVESDALGRRDFAVLGSCCCDKEDCDGSCNVPVEGGLTREEAELVLKMDNVAVVRKYLLSLPQERFKRDPSTGHVYANRLSPAKV